MSVNNSIEINSVKTEGKQPIFRKPRLNDGAEIYELIRSCRPLEINSIYSYLLLCRHFADTCVVAEEDGKIIAFLSGYIPPNKKGIYFIWQIAVDEKVRRRGIAEGLLSEALKREHCKNCHFIETTITPSNKTSWNFFLSIADNLNANYKESVYFSEKCFGKEPHEAEHLLQIGPLDHIKVK
jgi:L-2,4-diaminobutyric acid acetyltransferase